MRYCKACSIGLLATLCAVSPPLSGQSPPNPRVDAIFARWDRNDSPGCALGVVRNGALVYSRGYGMADLEAGHPMEPTSVFYLASVSKQFTAATVALLSLQGRLSLEDSIRRFFPELPQYADSITVRHLIHHTSGLRDYLSLMELAGVSLEDAHEPVEILGLIARQRGLNFAPGAQYLYSNTGYFLIPLIVERITGQSIQAFARDQLFGPLGMANTHFHDDYQHMVANRAYSYRRVTRDRFERSFLTRFDQVGSGGVLSTVEDLVLWDENFYRGSVGGPEFLDLIHERGVLNDGDTLDYAFGLERSDYKGWQTVQHAGSMMGFRTHFFRVPDLRFSVITLCNLSDINPEPLVLRVADAYLDTEFQPWAAARAGQFRSDELDVTWTVSAVGSSLFLDREGQPRQPLSPDADGTLRMPSGAALSFESGPDGAITSFVFDGGRVRGLRFVRQR